MVDEPPPDLLAWAEASAGRRVVGVQQMTGGIDAHTFRLALDNGDDVVLRVTEPDHHEDVDYLAQVLDRLAPTPIPAPLRLAHASAVGAGDVPVMLQTLLVGDPSIPVDPDDAWLDALVLTIVRMQDVGLEPWMQDRARLRWEQLDTRDGRGYEPGDELLLSRLKDVRHDVPLTPVFGHDDFWVGNTLRDGHRVVGIVDWGHAGVVSAARDVTYCAVDASLCYGLEVGDRLIDLFCQRVYVDPGEIMAWTARSVLASRWFPEWLAGWNGLGAQVGHEQAATRRADLLDRTLARLG